MRFVRVPPYESGVKLYFPGKMVNFFGAKSVLCYMCYTLFRTENEELSKIIGTRICIHTRIYAHTCQGWYIVPSAALYRVNFQTLDFAVGSSQQWS